MIYPLKGAFQHYAWGGTNYLAELTNRHDLIGKPCAELWFGDHPAAPADIDDGGWQPLDQWLTHHRQVLGAMQGGTGTLPFLLKLLDVAAPLSIQVHPNKMQAQAGFAREEADGIAPDSPARLYRDDNHKPEMMIALSDFWLLHGFAAADTIAAQLGARPSLHPVRDAIAQYGLDAAYAQILRSDAATVASWLLPLLQIAPDNHPDSPDYWLHETVRLMEMSHDNLDPGLLSFYLLNLLHLKRGQGIVQPAQLPHAYLRGQNIEIMARSDNVLRAGLTPKTVAIDELLRVISVDSIVPDVLPAAQGKGWHDYPSDFDDFTISVLHSAAGQSYQRYCPLVSIVLALGCAELCSGTQTLALNGADAALVTAGSHIELRSDSAAQIVLASCRMSLRGVII